ncbi:hypothetical protein D3C76_785690 [compost metagenome]
MLAIRPANPRFTHPGMEPLHRFEVLAVDVGFAKIQLAHGVQGLAEVAGIDRRGQSIVAVVGQGDGFIQVIDDLDRQHGTEDLLAHDLHVGAAAGQDGGLKMEAVRQVGNLPAADQACALAQCRADLLIDAVQALAIDQRAHLHIRLGDRIAVARSRHRGRDTLDELIRHLAFDIHPLGAIAHLAAVDDPRIANGLHRQVQVGIRQHNGRRLATEFQIEFGDVRRGGGHDP